MPARAPSSAAARILRDVRLSIRGLRRRPAFAAAALTTLALGFGAPTTIFTVVHTVLVRPLPFPEPDRLVRFRVESESPRGRITFDALPAATAIGWASSSTTLAGLALFNTTSLTLSAGDGPVRLTGVAATPELFDVLGVPPLAGATFAAGDRDASVIVLSHATWRQRFGGDRAVVGTSVAFDGRPFRVVGVMPESFEFPGPETAFWIPLLLSTGGTRGMLLPGIARLRRDASVAAAAAEVERHLADDGRDEQRRVTAQTLQDHMVGDVRRLLWLLLAAVSAVSAIAVLNVALLLLTRGNGRQREFAIRVALGAPRRHLVQQLAVEGLVLAGLGAVAGLVVAQGTIAVLVPLTPIDVPRLHQAALDGRAVLFLVAMAGLTGALFSVLGAGRLVALDAFRAVSGSTAESRVVPQARSRRRLNSLAGVEIALAAVLLVCAGLLLRSFVGLVLVDHGFDPRSRVAMQVTLPASRYATVEMRMGFLERLLGQLVGADGVRDVGVATALPHREPTGRFAYDAEGVPLFIDPRTLNLAEVRMVTEGFLDAMGIGLLEGRGIEATDTEGAEPVMVISRSLARLHFPEGNAVGAKLYSGSGTRRVVGVVGDVRPAPSMALQHDPAAYLPLRQSFDVLQQAGGIHVLVYASSSDRAIAQVRSAVSALDRELPVFNARTLQDEVGRLAARPRFAASAVGLIAVVALLMATGGVYGVTAYSTGQRTREIGVRIALGATRWQVLRLVLADALAVLVLGLAAGVASAAFLSRVMTGMLHDVSPVDPLAFVVVTLLLGGTALVAVLLPAARATRIDPTIALRDE